jgi:hypothetical protein
LAGPLDVARPNHLPDEDERRLWNAVAALGEPVTIQVGARIDIVLPDKTVDVANLAARQGVRLESGLLTMP